MDLTNDEKRIVTNLLMNYKGLTVAESATVIQIIQKIQAVTTPTVPVDGEEELPKEVSKS